MPRGAKRWRHRRGEPAQRDPDTGACPSPHDSPRDASDRRRPRRRRRQRVRRVVRPAAAGRARRRQDLAPEGRRRAGVSGPLGRGLQRAPGLRPQVVTLYKDTEELRNHYVFAAIGERGPDLIFGPADNVGTLGITETIRPARRPGARRPTSTGFSEDGLVRYDGAAVRAGGPDRQPPVVRLQPRDPARSRPGRWASWRRWARR